MTGNLLISVIAGLLTYCVLWIMGVPYKGVVALFVGFADLIPVVDATLGEVGTRWNQRPRQMSAPRPGRHPEA
jgi:hypothetical protein